MLTSTLALPSVPLSVSSIINKDVLSEILWKYDDEIMRSVLKDLIDSYWKNPSSLEIIREKCWINIDSFDEENLAKVAMDVSGRDIPFLNSYEEFLSVISERYSLDLDGSWIDQVCPINFEWYIHWIFSWWNTRWVLHDIYVYWNRWGVEFIFTSNWNKVMVAPSILKWLWRESFLWFDNFEQANEFLDRPFEDILRDLEKHIEKYGWKKQEYIHSTFKSFLKNTTSLTPISSYKQKN